jgi:hypothetical protein
LFAGDADEVTLITADYFDNFIVDRWSNRWLAGNITWVIAVTTNISSDIHYSWNLQARSVHILNEHFKGNNTIRFGIIDSYVDELLKETLGGK